MSYKNAIADMPLGGGKAVIIGDPAKDKTEARLLAYADASTRSPAATSPPWMSASTPADMPIIARGTKFVAGIRSARKGGGNFGPLTALGGSSAQGGREASARCGKHEGVLRSRFRDSARWAWARAAAARGRREGHRGRREREAVGAVAAFDAKPRSRVRSSSPNAMYSRPTPGRDPERKDRSRPSCPRNRGKQPTISLHGDTWRGT